MMKKYLLFTAWNPIVLRRQTDPIRSESSRELEHHDHAERPPQFHDFLRRLSLSAKSEDNTPLLLTCEGEMKDQGRRVMEMINVNPDKPKSLLKTWFHKPVFTNVSQNVYYKSTPKRSTTSKTCCRPVDTYLTTIPHEHTQNYSLAGTDIRAPRLLQYLHWRRRGARML